MATILLQAAGAFLGGALGPIGATLGTAAGAIAGYLIDRALIDSTRHSEGPRLSGARPFSAEEGASLPRVYGTVRIGGTMIWATRFEEEARTERQGGKGGPRTTTYSYYANVAFALCEGELAGIRRVWADGRELDLDLVDVRFHAGSETQGADPLIEARQGGGNTPAYRGTAYVVLDRFPLADYGNRIPQFQFEVMRPVGSVHRRVRAVALIPGSTEYGLSPHVVTRTLSPGEVMAENRHILHAGSDFRASLDELQALCPELEHVALVVTWFGDDLRAGHCTIRPKVTHHAGGLSQDWTVSGLSRGAAQLVSEHEGGAAYGGTPSDRSVMDAIAELKARGLKVTLYPFVMMDVPTGNTLANPYTGSAGQPAYPWRGRITCNPGPGASGSADKTLSARSQIAAFCGSAAAADFVANGDTVTFLGDAGDWGYRRLVLHYARLSVAAGGVDAFLLGSEMRGLTTLRDNAGAFPFVEQLCDLAAAVRGIVGGGTKITYGADWTEYFGHQPADGTGDVFFHLDPLWSHPEIDAVGIDCYMPLADWRDGDEGGGNPDGFSHPYDISAMRKAIAGGEGFDWYYANEADRLARARTPITDGGHGKPWVFRYKDLVSWWSNRHFDRPGGAEAGTPTGWVPASKPLWLTELGAPAVDKGPNQPNVFPDPKSAENAMPWFSNGGRSDVAAPSLITAHLDRWDGTAADFDGAANPVSDRYAGRMLDASRIYLWAWDARPYPAFPMRADVWSDGRNWLLGHWLNGRINGVAVSDLLNAILADWGLEPADAARAPGMVMGYLVPDPATARAALEPLVELFGLTVTGEGERLMFGTEGAPGRSPATVEEFALVEDRSMCTRTRIADHELPAEIVLSFSDASRDYQAATSRAFVADAAHRGQRQMGFPGVLDPGMADALASDWLRRAWTARERIDFAVEQTRIDVAPGGAVRTPDGDFLVTSVDAGARREVAARRIRPVPPSPWRAGLLAPPRTRTPRAGPPLALLLDLPMLPGATGPEDQLRLAVRAKPWAPHAVYASPASTGFERRGLALQESVVGILRSHLAPGFEGRFDNIGRIEVELLHGELSSVADIQLLNGANIAAIRSATGEWEVLQFAHAEEVAPSIWRLGRLLRGQFGTRPAMRAGAEPGAYFVLLDGAVSSAGLKPHEIGLALNWRIGPLGYDFAGPAFASLSVTGGERARKPLSPVHLAAVRRSDGDVMLSWIRRGRIDADRGIAGSIPLGEEQEAYRVEIAPEGSPPVRAVTVSDPSWLYAAASLASDFPVRPAVLDVTVRQLGTGGYAGDAGTLRFNLT